MEPIELEKVIIVSVNDGKNDELFSYRMKEIENLALSCDFQVMDTVVQNLEHPNSKTFVGKGKLEEIKNLLDIYDVKTVIFEDGLTPSQITNIKQILDCEIIDRNMLILLIFESRAKTIESSLQVSIAKLKYMLPRLIGNRTYLSRTGGGASGGTGARRGSGETKLELDRRHIESKIVKLEADLKEVVKNRSQNRKMRKNNNVKVCAVVGYTNVGKSTTINNLLNITGNINEDKQVYTKDMLFATLETSTRRIKTIKNHEFLITDTVGFVSNLPHHLVESFKSTLEEIKDADLIIHIIDASSPYLAYQVETTLNVLKELGACNIPMINVYNKTDLVSDFVLQSLDKLDSIFINSKDLSTYNLLLDKIEENLFGKETEVELIIPYEKGDIFNNIMQNGNIIKTDYLPNGIYVHAVISDYLYNLYKIYKK